jgi:cyclopropane-fatty-acyl-phospholipid synthase
LISDKPNPLKLPLGPAGNLNRQAPSEKHEAPITALEKRLLRKLIEALGDPPLRVTAWDGNELFRTVPQPVTGFTLHSRSALWRLLGNPNLNFADEYCSGRIDVEGGLVRFVEAIQQARPTPGEPGILKRLLPDLLNRPRRNTLNGSRDNIHQHYDLGNNFYRLWLDEAMQYTCAYFPTPEMTLEAAQIAKMDHVCRKLQLKPGEQVVEAGCGWGTMALHMARHYGVKVKAFNISHEQIDAARQRASDEGLQEQVEFIEDDYRNIKGKYDAFVSIGMLEHVGLSHYEELGTVIDRSLSANGRGLIHSIGQVQAEPLNAWIEKRIFPGAYPPTLRQMLEVLEPWAFAVLDVENLRLHYAKTIERWLVRFEQHATEIEQMFDSSFVRAWRFYLSSSIASFNTGSLQLFQVLFTRPNNNDIPWNRAHLYETNNKVTTDGEL